MANLITLDWFDGDANMPARDKTGSDQGLQRYINEYEPKFMREVLGVGFYEVFKTDQADPRMQELINGVIYQVDGKDKYWQGLASETGTGVNTVRLSPIADYVFYMWNKGKVTRPSNAGRVIPAVDNSTLVNPVQIMVKVWNKMVETNRSMYWFLKNNATVYPEWEYAKCNCNFFETINEFGF